jgi:hypothetical protein
LGSDAEPTVLEETTIGTYKMVSEMEKISYVTKS